MACCPASVIVFNGAIVNEAYTASMRAQYGDLPRVEVLYLVDGEYVLAGIFTQVQFNGSSILVDNGGQMRGILKIS